MKVITARQREILKYMKKLYKKNGYIPTYREIEVHFGIQTRAVYDHVKALEKKGYIKKVPKTARAILFLK